MCVSQLLRCMPHLSRLHSVQHHSIPVQQHYSLGHKLFHWQLMHVHVEIVVSLPTAFETHPCKFGLSVQQHDENIDKQSVHM
jgi:hypothetical protein